MPAWTFPYPAPQDPVVQFHCATDHDAVGWSALRSDGAWCWFCETPFGVEGSIWNSGVVQHVTEEVA